VELNLAGTGADRQRVVGAHPVWHPLGEDLEPRVEVSRTRNLLDLRGQLRSELGRDVVDEPRVPLLAQLASDLAGVGAHDRSVDAAVGHEPAALGEDPLGHHRRPAVRPHLEEAGIDDQQGAAWRDDATQLGFHATCVARRTAGRSVSAWPGGGIARQAGRSERTGRGSTPSRRPARPSSTQARSCRMRGSSSRVATALPQRTGSVPAGPDWAGNPASGTQRHDCKVASRLGFLGSAGGVRVPSAPRLTPPRSFRSRRLLRWGRRDRGRTGLGPVRFGAFPVEERLRGCHGVATTYGRWRGQRVARPRASPPRSTPVQVDPRHLRQHMAITRDR
jgi:hypothetical protein